MDAVAARFRAEFRRHGKGWLLLGVVVGLTAGVAVAAAAGARRTESAYGRFLGTHLAADVVLFHDGESPPNPPAAEVLRLPQVAVGARGKIYYSIDNTAAFVPRDERAGSVVHRFTLLEGRRPDPDRVDEVMIGFVLAERRGLHVGSTFPLIEPEFEADAAKEGIRNIDLKVVGIEASPGEFPPQYVGGMTLIHHTPAFYRAYRKLLPERDSLLVRLERGRADLPAFLTGLQRLAAGKPLFYQTEAVTTEPIQRSFHLQAVALWILAGLLAVAAALVFAQTLARQAFLEAAEAPLLRALGMTRRQLWLAGMARAGVIALGAGATAVLLAVLLSPLAPLGVARKAEPDPGLSFDPVALGAGAAGAALLVLALSAWPAWRAAGIQRDSLGTALLETRRRPSRLAGALARLGCPAPAAAGARLALEPGRGRGAVPVRTTLAGLVLAIAALTGSLVFAASLVHLLHTPRLYGWNWDLAITNYGSGPDLRTRIGALTSDPRIAGLSVGDTPIPLAAGGVEFAALAVDGVVTSPVLEGRAPTGPDEIALATKTLRRLGLGVGSQIAVRLPGVAARRLRIVGRTVVPPPVESRLGEGALMTFTAVERFVPSLTAGYVLLRLAPGVDREDLTRELRPRLGEPFVVLQPESPADILNFGRIDELPVILAAVLALLACATLAHTLVSGVRRRRRDLAVLKALGFVGGQVVATVAWQATILVSLALVAGIPLGIAGGRWTWTVVADRAGFAREPVVPLWALLIVVGATVTVANLVALMPARVAARIQPATALRAE